MADPVFNAGDEAQVKDRKAKARMDREAEVEALKDLMKDKRFRDFLGRALCACGILKQSFTGNSNTFFNEGQRNVGLWLMREATEADPVTMGEILGGHVLNNGVIHV
jgi:hypothetical protein